jgi:hypothetical protein
MYIEGDFFGPISACAGTGQSNDFNCVDHIRFITMDFGPTVVPHEFQAVGCFVKTPQTLIECTSPVGVGKNMKYKVQVGAQKSPFNTQLTDPSALAGTVVLPHYAHPVVSILSRSEGASTEIGPQIDDADTRGYTVDEARSDQYSKRGMIPETVLITGLNFGPVNSGTCLYTGRPCGDDSDCYNFTSGNTCEGVAGSVAWNPTTGIYVAKKPEKGQTSPDAHTATNCIVTIAHTQMKCDFVPGAGKSHEWTVTVGMQDSLTPTSSYHEPIINVITGDGASEGRTNGGQVVVLHGLNFGPYDDGATVTYGVTGKEYSPTGCAVLNHSAIQCHTVPGIGANLLWQVVVRQQTNILGATTSYAAPFIHSITPWTASADGSEKRNFLIYLNVSNSGLADPLTRRVVQFDIACTTFQNSCGSYEIAAEVRNPEATRAEGAFDIIAFSLPMLLNEKDAVDVPISIIVYPYDRETGNSLRGTSAVPSSNTVLFTYDDPVIDQIIVLDHPTSPNQRLIHLIGKNYGSVAIGEHPVNDHRMKVLSYPRTDSDVEHCSLSNGIGAPVEIGMRLGVAINGSAGTFVQQWERGAEQELYDLVTLVFTGRAGKLAVSRGGQTSNVVCFDKKTPVLEKYSKESGPMKWRQNDGSFKNLKDGFPTIGSSEADDGSSEDYRLDLQCQHCGSEALVCCSDDQISGTNFPYENPTTDCTLTCSADDREKGVPRDLTVWIGSAQLSSEKLVNCPIIADTLKYRAAEKSWRFSCQVPAYQGSRVETRIRYVRSWSNAQIISYLPPKIASLSMSLGGKLGTFNHSSGQESVVRTSSTTVLLVRTKGQLVKITGSNFGIPHAGDVTNYNQKNILYDRDNGGEPRSFRPFIMEPPKHGGFGFNIPPGTSSRRRSVDLQTGQFMFDLQESRVTGTTMYVAYRKPTIVKELVPLWRFDSEGNAGGFEVTLYGYDFLSKAQILRETSDNASYDFADHTSILYKAELVNVATNQYRGTPCKIVSTDYDRIVCRVGALVPAQTASQDDDVAVVLEVDGQITLGYLAKSEVEAAHSAVKSGEYNEDQYMKFKAKKERDQMFAQQVHNCTEKSGGLTNALRLSKTGQDELSGSPTPQEEGFAVSNVTLLAPKQAEMRKCVGVVVTAFYKACDGSINDEETAAVLEASYLYDEKNGKPDTRTSNKCPSGAVSISTSSDSSSDNNRDPPTILGVDAVPDVKRLPTRGGDILRLSTLSLDIGHNYRAFLVDDGGIYPRIPMRGAMSGNEVLEQSDFEAGTTRGIYGSLYVITPPGQGRRRRIVLESDALFAGQRRISVKSGSDIVGYRAPSINATATSLPVRTTTDTCLPNQYESELSWKARVDNLRNGIVDGKRIAVGQTAELDQRLFDRRCLKHDTLVLHGNDFGEETKQIMVWVVGQEIRVDGNIAEGPPISFMVFNGSAYFDMMDEASDVLNRGFAGTSTLFSLVHKHDLLVLRGPRGYGPNCTLHVKIADQEITVDFSFKAPEAHYTTPRAYNGNGQAVEIIGTNFGGVQSFAKVEINGETCDNAQWHSQHDVVGLPFIACDARRTLVGIGNVSVYVAGQQGHFFIGNSLETAGVSSVCVSSSREEDIDLETGNSVEWWGRNEPAGELCAKCQTGSLCQSGTYEAPISLAGFYVVDLDITAGSRTLIPADGVESLTERRARRDYDRALETFLDGERVCAPERILDPSEDSKYVEDYPFAVPTKRGLCLSVQPCKPSKACAGRNKCNVGYQYNELRCNSSAARRSSTGAEIVQACNHSLQCQVRSRGIACTDAVAAVCLCPEDWELGARACLKACVSDSRKLALLEAAGCTQESLDKGLAEFPCAYDKPEDCAVCKSEKVCVTSAGVETGTICSSRGDCIASAGFDGTCQKRGRCTCGPSSRCSLCTAGTYYRLDGKCEKCPESPELVFALFVVGVFLMIFFAYLLDQMKFNLAFLIIPIDYFQVLALISRSDIRWPAFLLQVLRALQFFNFNVDIATPECLLKGVFTYEMKYYGTLLFAPSCIVFLALAWLLHVCHHRVCLRRKPDKLYASKLVSTFMLLIYCVYLSCTTRALEVLNCSPTDPDDGKTYVGFTDLSCDGGGLCRCGDPEHLPMKLLVPTLVALGVYTAGFPLFLVWLFCCGDRRSLLKEDQILRASGLGDTLKTNPRAFHIRLRYHKMYYYYKPGKTYWMLIILSRKVGIAFCSLVFKTNPGFMLASIVLILFIAFSLQTRHSPYMSSSQRRLVLAEHSIKAESGDYTHMRIQSNLKYVTDEVQRIARDKAERKTKLRFSITRVWTKSNMTDKKEKAEEYFFDYNTVELFLLFCAILVCLAGIMFESDRFKEGDDLGSRRYSWHRDTITYFVIFIVVLSFVYLLAVIVNEITGYTPICIQRLFKQKQSALMSAADTIKNQKDDHIEMSTLNPQQLMADMSNPERANFKRQLAEQEMKNKQVEEESRKLKVLVEQQKLAGQKLKVLVAQQKLAGKKTGR